MCGSKPITRDWWVFDILCTSTADTYCVKCVWLPCLRIVVIYVTCLYSFHGNFFISGWFYVQIHGPLQRHQHMDLALHPAAPLPKRPRQHVRATRGAVCVSGVAGQLQLTDGHHCGTSARMHQSARVYEEAD
jgi:hypothetical protein